MKKIFSLTLVFVFISAMCFAGGSSETASSNAEASGKTTISMTWWGDTARNEVYNKVIDEFEKANPDIVVERPFATWANYFDKLSTQMAGGVAPDVIGMHQRYVTEYASRGALLDLGPYVESGILDLSDIPESVVESGKIDGKLYMISQGITGSGLSYFTKTFDELGVAYPDENWTWDEYVAKLEEIKSAADAKGKTGLLASQDLSFDFYNFSYYVRGKGENLFTEDGQLGFTKETMVEWFDLWADLRNRGLIVDPATSVEYLSLPLEQSLMATGQVAIAGMPISQVRLYQELVDDGRYVLVRFPHFEDGPNPEYISGASYCINSKSKNPEEAVKLMNFFLNDSVAQSIFKQEQGLPPATSAVKILEESATEAEKESIRFVEECLLPNATAEPYPPAGYNEVNSNYVNYATAVAFGTMSSQQAVDEFFAACEAIL